MASLPPNTPRWAIWLANAVFLVIMVGVGLFAKSIDIRYIVGFLVGALYVYFLARWLHGIWLFNDD